MHKSRGTVYSAEIGIVTKLVAGRDNISLRIFFYYVVTMRRYFVLLAAPPGHTARTIWTGPRAGARIYLYANTPWHAPASAAPTHRPPCFQLRSPHCPLGALEMLPRLLYIIWGAVPSPPFACYMCPSVVVLVKSSICCRDKKSTSEWKKHPRDFCNTSRGPADKTTTLASYSRLIICYRSDTWLVFRVKLQHSFPHYILSDMNQNACP